MSVSKGNVPFTALNHLMFLYYYQKSVDTLQDSYVSWDFLTYYVCIFLTLPKYIISYFSRLYPSCNCNQSSYAILQHGFHPLNQLDF